RFDTSTACHGRSRSKLARLITSNIWPSSQSAARSRQCRTGVSTRCTNCNCTLTRPTPTCSTPGIPALSSIVDRSSAFSWNGISSS
ncbi:hypothetical protein PFISCL1PPCAC_17194, partial [Pristionchus fissidentatus]